MTSSPLDQDATSMRRPRSRRRLLARFTRDRTGAAALEFALVALPFMTMIVFIIEVALDFLFFSHVDYATHKAVQQIRSGAVQTQQLTMQQFKSDVLCPQMALVPCAPALVNMRVMKTWCCSPDGWNGWTQTTVSADTGLWCPGGAADLVFLQVAYPVPLGSFIWSGDKSVADGKKYYLSTVAVRNDPFGLPPDKSPGC